MAKMNKEQEERAIALDKIEKQYEKELIHNYQQALKELRARIAFMYEKYDGNWIEMNRYNRLTKLEKEIANEIRILTGKNAQTLIRGMMETYEEAYYRTAYILTNAVEADLAFATLDRELVRKAIENPLDRVGFLQRNLENQARLTRQLRENLTQSLIQGESYRTAAKRIKGRMDVGATNVLRITRTEMHRVRHQAQYESMVEGEKRGITLTRTWLSAIDSRTRHSHARADGQTVRIDKPYEVNGEKLMYPGDPAGSPENVINCRCTELETVDGFKPQYRRIKGVGIVKYTTFSDFKKKGLIH